MTEDFQHLAIGLALLEEEETLAAEERALRAEDKALRAVEAARLAADQARMAREQAESRAAASRSISLRPISLDSAPVLALQEQASKQLVQPIARQAFALTVAPVRELPARTFRGDLRAIRCILHREIRGFFVGRPRLFATLVKPALLVCAFSLASLLQLAKLTK